jgi:hypothetical protein
VREEAIRLADKLAREHPEVLALVGPATFARRQARRYVRLASARAEAGDAAGARAAMAEARALRPGSLAYHLRALWLALRARASRERRRRLACAGGAGGGSPAKWALRRPAAARASRASTHFAGEPPARTTLAGPDGDAPRDAHRAAGRLARRGTASGLAAPAHPVHVLTTRANAAPRDVAAHRVPTLRGAGGAVPGLRVPTS